MDERSLLRECLVGVLNVVNFGVVKVLVCCTALGS